MYFVSYVSFFLEGASLGQKCCQLTYPDQVILVCHNKRSAHFPKQSALSQCNAGSCKIKNILSSNCILLLTSNNKRRTKRTMKSSPYISKQGDSYFTKLKISKFDCSQNMLLCSLVSELLLFLLYYCSIPCVGTFGQRPPVLYNKMGSVIYFLLILLQLRCCTNI